MDLEPVEKLRGRAAASVLGGQDADAVESAEQAGR
jgi:hypothetical protein